MISSVANLAAHTGELITINFDPVFHSATPGSSAWSLVATNIRIRLIVQKGRYVPDMIMTRLRARLTVPNIFVQQIVWLLPVNRDEFIGTVPLSLYIHGGSDGLAHTHQQIFLFDRLFRDFNENDPNPVASNALIDPISQSPRFQVNLFNATPFARVDMGTWSSISLD